MKILYISGEWMAPDLCLRLKNEGNDVYLALEEESEILKGTIKRIPYETRLEFAKSCDLILYDDKAKGEPAMLRKQGLSVIGGCKNTDKSELDRLFANNVAKACGMKVPEVHEIKNLEEAKKFIEKEGGKWVLKQMGKLDGVKGLNGVARMENSEDLLAKIDKLIEIWPENLKQEFILQEKVEGHEFACGSYWNGKEFMKDKDGNEICEENWEHKPLFAGNMGESTGEQFTVMHYVKASESKIFKETLDKLRPFLKKIDYRGDFDINCIINEKGVYFLEFTPRMGVPATSAQIAIHKTLWGEFLKAMADGQQTPFEHNEGYCIVSWLYTKPFPAMQLKMLEKYAEKVYDGKLKDDQIAESMAYKLMDSYGIPVLFKEKLSKTDLDNLHFDGTMLEKGQLKIANSDGYVLTATGMGETVDEAGEKVEALLKKIVIPNGFWRNDFKKSNYHHSRNDLIDWGYLNEEKDEDEMQIIKNEIKEILKETNTFKADNASRLQNLAKKIKALGNNRVEINKIENALSDEEFNLYDKYLQK